MSTFGLKIWNAAGAVTIDENSFTIRVVYTGLVTMTGTARQVQTVALAEITTGTHIAFVIPTGTFTATPAASSQKQFEVQLINGQVNVYNYAYTNATVNTTIAAGTMRLIILRFA